MLLDVQVGLAQIALVVLEQLEIGADDVSAGRQLHILAMVRVASAVGQLLAHITHVADDHRATRPQALLTDVRLALVQATSDMVFEEVGGVLGFVAEDFHVICAHRRLVEVVDHARGHNPHLMTLAHVDEDVGLNLRHITEEAIHILRCHQPDLAGLDQVKQVRHARTILEPGRATHTRVHVDHEDAVT